MKHPIPDAALAHHLAILGKTGTGKSYTAQGIAELLLARGERLCVIDPTGRWWGLRSNAAGTGPGFPVVVFGGAHADVPLAQSHGDALAEIIGTTNTPAILDTRAMGVGERTRFFADFAESLLRKNKGPLTLIIDEAHLFAPQGRVNDPQSGKMLHAANNLVSLGRGIGLRIILLTQRPAKLHKDSLTQVETLIALRLIAPQDRRAVEDWIGEWADPKEGREVMASLASLPTGTGWIWAPELGVLKKATFPAIKTYDSGKAPQEDDGKGPVLASIDLPSIQARLGKVAEDAKANDPKALRAEIVALKRRLAEAAAPDPAALQAEYERGKQDGTIATGQRFAVYFDNAINAAENNWREQLKADSDRIVRSAPPKVTQRAGIAQSVERRPSKSEVAGSIPAARSTHQGVTPAQQRILDGLAWLEAVGITAPDKSQVALIIKVSPTSGGYFNNLGSLRSAGLIEYPSGGMVSLTTAGRAAASAPDAPPTTADLHAQIERLLPPAKWKIVAELIATYPEAMHKDELAQRIGVSPTSGGYFNNLGSLRTLGLISYPQPGQVVALPILFVD